MKLEYILGVDSTIELLRDGCFESLSNVTTETETKCLSFANNEDFIKKACKKNNITCMIVPCEYRDHTELLESGKGILLSQNPKLTFHLIHNYLSETKDTNYIRKEFDTVIGENCFIHDSAIIAKKNVIIGNHVKIEENVIIKEDVEIGDDVVIMAGAIIGNSSCLAGRDREGNLMPLISTGKVRIGNKVQIGSYTGINRGLFPYETTEIGEYTLISHSVNLGHNVHVGRNAIILDQSQVCGNTVVKDNVHIAPRAIVSNRLKIEEEADVAIGAVVVNNIKRGLRVAGNYAIENSKFLLWHRQKLRAK